jgi:NADH:ubiquinone oxidoreductase subunit 4 (subunit M)
MSLGLIGVVYGSLTTLYQIDLKKIIAYSSVAHMNLTVVGVFSLNHYGLQGSVFMMLGHGIISSGLFFLVGVLYDRHHTRSVFYYGGLAQVMPLYGVMLLFFMLGNMSFPGTCNFIGELLILVGIFKAFPLVAVLSATGVVFSAAYSIFVFNRIVFTNVKYQYISKYKDITRLEFMVLLPLVFFGIVLGILPEFVLDYTYLSVKFLTI